MLTGSEKGDSGCLWAGRGKVIFLIFLFCFDCFDNHMF